MDRPDAGPARRAGARAGRRDLPHLRRRATTCSSTAAASAATAARSRGSTRRCSSTCSRRRRASTAWPGRCRSTRPGRRRTRRSSTAQTLATWMRRNIATKSGRMLLELGVEAVWAAQPEDMSLLHVLFYIHSAGALELLFDTEGGAQQDRFVGGSQRISLRMAEELGEERVRPRRAGAPRSSTAPDGVTVHADGVTARGRRAIVAIAPTLAGRIAYDPPLPGLPRPAHPADAARHGRQVHGDLRRAVLARRGPVRARRISDAGPVRLTFDNSPPDGSPGRAARLPRGPPRARARPVAAGGAPHRGDRLLHAPVRPARGRARTTTSSGSGPRRSGRAAATAATCPPAAGPTTAPALRAPIGPLHWAGAEYAHGLERLHGRRGALGRRYGC